MKDNIDTSDFNQGVSSTSSIRVTDTELTASFETYNGQVADDDNQIDVEGTAPGKDNVAAIIIGSRGKVKFQSISVDSDDTFDEEDIDISSSDRAVLPHTSSRRVVTGSSVRTPPTALAILRTKSVTTPRVRRLATRSATASSRTRSTTPPATTSSSRSSSVSLTD